MVCTSDFGVFIAGVHVKKCPSMKLRDLNTVNEVSRSIGPGNKSTFDQHKININ